LAFANATTIIDIERELGLFHEAAIQAAFLDSSALIVVLNFFYATAHFVVPIVVLGLLFARAPGEYTKWRNVLVITTLTSLVLFALFPVMPPRLLGSCGRFGACTVSPFVDTLRAYGGAWSFESGPVAKLSNQFAAMPSLHFAWALWCWLALSPVISSRRWWLLAGLYPLTTLTAIVVTGNHYVLDAVGGAIVVGVSWWVATWWDRRRLARRPAIELSETR
jgi:hypothetical protein